ncbi:hypothetical protein Agub_g11744 [Astrephomene gubernaculifera]|uniref:Phospholipid scramblase n=1 Tax=Astrephomene gubernaculifera TaxID=47775 RepID=A0AAD3HQ82_9CHLO|nr:hypothetical protein Agub_g11744 [Astrephomene gubernaculifera]
MAAYQGPYQQPQYAQAPYPQAAYVPSPYPQQPHYGQPPYAQPQYAEAPIPPAPCMQPPYVQPIQGVMPENLETYPGLVVKETTQVIDAIMASVGGAYEAANKYHVKAMPVDKRSGTDHDEPGAWLPSSAEIDQLPEVFFVEEESSCLLRACLAYWGGLNLRALKLRYYHANYEKYYVDRPCMCGGCCCCPLEMTVYQKGPEGDRMVGMVVEDFDPYCLRCYQCCCLNTYYQKVLVGGTRESLVHKYSLVNPMCCCGRVNNCCGATCCIPSFFIDILEPNGTLAAVAQKTYGGGDGCADCCRCVFDFNNYVLPFPPKANHHERLMLLTGLLSVEYAYHSRKGGEGNNNSGGSS